VEQVLRQHPASFRPLYPQRQVNNIYFDSPTLDEFYQNVAGTPQRRKHRLRWYGTEATELPDPVFEIKIKDGELGTKESQPLPTTAWTDLKSLFAQLPALTYLPLRPVLVNSYQRTYWRSFDGRFRITIDWDLSFAPFHWSHPSPTTQFLIDTACVLELKYEQEHDSAAKAIFDHLPFRLTKNSKYVMGVSLVMG
jgi:hypothetical protein